MSARARFGTAILTLLPALLLLAPLTAWPWLGVALGRFHPTIVHFPVALLFLVLLLEIVSALSRGRLIFPQRFILGVAAAGAVLAATLGYLLMRGEQTAGALVERHFYLGLSVAALSVVTLLVRLTASSDAPGATRLLYRVLLLGTCVTLTIAAHDGGSLVHGEDYLTEHIPWLAPKETAKVASFPQDKPAEEWQAYANVVAPILESRCYRCHNSTNFKGKLVLDTWEGITAGGEKGALFAAGRPADSALIQRLKLPLSHKEHMPPKDKPQPADAEITLLEFWVKAGAPHQGTLASLKADHAIIAHATRLPQLLTPGASPEAAPVETEIDPAAITRARAPLAAQIEALQQQWPGVLAYESRDSARLVINASLLADQFTDADLAKLDPLVSQIALLDLRNTAVTDAAARHFAGMKALHTLRLGNTRVGDQVVAVLPDLPELTSLNLYRTAITQAALPALSRLPKVKTLGLDETAISAEAARTAKLPGY